MRRERRSLSVAFAAGAVAVVVGLAAALAMGEIAARVMFPRWSEFDSSRFMAAAEVPGWPDLSIGRPGFDGWFSQNNGDFRAHIRINDFGLRNDEPVEAADGRLWALGDSFAFGWGVEREQTFGAVAASRLGMAWYSVASPGTDLCGYRTQLVRLSGRAKPAAVILGLTIENDVMVYDCAGKAAARPPEGGSGGFRPSLLWAKHELTRVSALYNFVVVSVKGIDGLRTLLTRLHLISAIVNEDDRPAPDRLEASLDSTAAEIGRLRADLPPGTPLTLLLIPARQELLSDDSGYRAMRQGMASRVAAMGIPVIDPIAALREVGLEGAHFRHDGHWTPLGHRIAGELAAVSAR